MAYIGREPQVGNFQVCDAISVVNGQAAYTMQVGGVNVSPETANHMLVSLNGILQAPTTSYTVSGSTITFASNLVTGDVINFIQILGSVLDLGVPSDSTVSLAKLTATGTKNSSTFLRGDNTFASAGGGKILQVVQGTSTTAFTQSSPDNSTRYFPSSNKITASITPSATSSKIIVQFQTTIIMTSGSGEMGAAMCVKESISGGSTTTIESSGDAYGSGLYFPSTVSSNVRVRLFESILRTPNTTSAITYEVGLMSYALTAIGLNNNSSKGIITLMEVDG